MPLDLQHRIRFIIRLVEPVDQFDVIYKLKIITRNDFSATTKQIVLVDEIPKKSDSEFFQTYSYIWNSPSNYFSFKDILDELATNPANIEEKFKNQFEMISMRNSYNIHRCENYYEPPTDTFENYYEYWNIIFTKFNEFLTSKSLDSESEKVLNIIMQTPELMNNIKSIGWEDYWLTC